MAGHSKEHEDYWANLDIQMENERVKENKGRSKGDYFTELLNLVPVSFGEDGLMLPVAMIPDLMSVFTKKIRNN
jgi:hypothetical protein